MTDTLAGGAIRGRSLLDRLSFGPREFVLAATALIVAFLVTRPVVDPDYWWHVRTGAWIVQHLQLPGHDLYTYTVTGHPWPDQEWLTEVGMWLLQSHLGLTGVGAVFGLVALGGFALLWETVRRERPVAAVAGFALCLAALTALPIVGARPQVTTFAFVCLELLWLRRHLAGASCAIWWLPALMVFWANLHGGWPIAFAFVGMAVLVDAGRWVAEPNRRPEHLRRLRRLGIVSALTALAPLCTPNGLSVYVYGIRTLSSPAQEQLITEWQSPNLHDPLMLPFAAMVLLLLVGYAFSRPRLFDVLVAALTLAMALMSLRNILLFVAAATPSLIVAWSEVWHVAVARIPPRQPRTVPALARSLLNAGALMFLAVVSLAGIARMQAGQPTDLRQMYPVAATNLIASGSLSCPRIFDTYDWGGYLIDRLPKSRVFIFGEAEVMGDQQLFEYAHVDAAGAGWANELRRTRTDCVLIQPGSGLARALAHQQGWRLAYRDRVSVLYVRDPVEPAAGRQR